MKGNSKNKVGNKKGGPAYRTPSTFIAQQSFKGGNFKNQNNLKRPTKVFNRGK